MSLLRKCLSRNAATCPVLQGSVGRPSSAAHLPALQLHLPGTKAYMCSHPGSVLLMLSNKSVVVREEA